jgi:hypothetical protein
MARKLDIYIDQACPGCAKAFELAGQVREARQPIYWMARRYRSEIPISKNWWRK